MKPCPRAAHRAPDKGGSPPVCPSASLVACFSSTSHSLTQGDRNANGPPTEVTSPLHYPRERTSQCLLQMGSAPCRQGQCEDLRTSGLGGGQECEGKWRVSHTEAESTALCLRGLAGTCSRPPTDQAPRGQPTAHLPCPSPGAGTHGKVGPRYLEDDIHAL